MKPPSQSEMPEGDHLIHLNWFKPDIHSQCLPIPVVSLYEREWKYRNETKMSSTVMLRVSHCNVYGFQTWTFGTEITLALKLEERSSSTASENPVPKQVHQGVCWIDKLNIQYKHTKVYVHLKEHYQIYKLT
jgi:hypothetical protein